MKARTQDDYIRTALRVPPELHPRIHEAAKEAGRTFNAQIVHMLQAYLDDGGTEAEEAVGISIGLSDPLDRAAVLKAMLFNERMLLKRRIDELGGREAVLAADPSELSRKVTGPRIEGSDSEKKTYLTSALGTYPLTTLFTESELGKLAERVVALQVAMKSGVAFKDSVAGHCTPPADKPKKPKKPKKPSKT